jgi:hypothetical protein
MARQYACPTIEELDRLGASPDLMLQVLTDSVGQQVDKPLKSIRISESPALDVRKPGRCATATLDHVSGDGPRGTSKADQGNVGRKCQCYSPDGFVYRCEAFVDDLGIQLREAGGRADGWA